MVGTSAALISVINVAIAQVAAGVRDEGHIGMESLIGPPPQKAQFVVGNLVGVITIVFGAASWPGAVP